MRELFITAFCVIILCSIVWAAPVSTVQDIGSKEFDDEHVVSTISGVGVTAEVSLTYPSVAWKLVNLDDADAVYLNTADADADASDFKIPAGGNLESTVPRKTFYLYADGTATVQIYSVYVK